MRIRPLPTIKGYTPIHTIGDGNCLFNSISLAWMDMEAAGLQNDDESLALLTSSFRKIHGDIPFNLEEIRNNPTEVQRLLSPVFRKIACEKAKQTEKDNLSRDNWTTLSGTLCAYTEEQLRKKWNLSLNQERDDIFSDHKIVKDSINTIIDITSNAYIQLANSQLKVSDSHLQRFLSRFNWYVKRRAKKLLIEDLHSEVGSNILSNQETLVQQWWNGTGHESFFDSMSQDKKWAGDIELNALANLFQFNVTVLQAKQPPLKLIEEFDKRPTIYLHKSANHWTYCRKNQPAAVSSTPLLDATSPKKSSNSLTSLLGKFNFFKQSSSAKKPNAPAKKQTESGYLGSEKGKERLEL